MTSSYPGNLSYEYLTCPEYKILFLNPNPALTILPDLSVEKLDVYWNNIIYKWNLLTNEVTSEGSRSH